jgi:hypothetical protein
MSQDIFKDNFILRIVISTQRGLVFVEITHCEGFHDPVWPVGAGALGLWGREGVGRAGTFADAKMCCSIHRTFGVRRHLSPNPQNSYCIFLKIQYN